MQNKHESGRKTTNHNRSSLPSGHIDAPRSGRGRTPYSQSAYATRMHARQAAKARRRATGIIVFLLVLIAGLLFAGGAALFGGHDDPPAPSVTTDGETTAAVINTDDTGNATIAPITTHAPDTDPPITTDPPVTYPPKDKTVVCIDPGHGYGDPGAVSTYLDEAGKTEKDINLEIALKLRDILEADGYEVIMTRDSDVLPSNAWFGDLLNPEERVEWLREQGDVDYFISIHCNSWAGENRAYGTRLYYYTGNDKQTGNLVQAIADGIEGRVGGKKPTLNAYGGGQAYTVTRHQICPALLIEVGFLTDEEDAAKMLDPAWQEGMARGIANGLESHVKAIEAGK